MEMQRIPLVTAAKKCYFVCTQLEFPSSKLPQSIWLPWAYFFIIPERVYSPVSVNSIWISISGRDFHQEIAAGTRGNLSNLPRSKEVATGFPLLPPSSPTLAQKRSYLSEIILSRTPTSPVGNMGWRFPCGAPGQVQQALFRSLLHEDSPLQLPI